MKYFDQNEKTRSINLTEYNFFVIMTEAKKTHLKKKISLNGDFDVIEELLLCLTSSRNSALNEP